jgi:hypothetical protein
VLLRLSLRDVLGSLLPDRWAARHPEDVLQHRLDEAQQKARRERRRPNARG